MNAEDANSTSRVGAAQPLVAACLIFRNSAAYLQEWLLYHGAAGVGRFYLYDNDSTDDFRAVLQPWRDSGAVEIIPWPGVNRQQAAYDDALARARADGVAWLAFIDDDEFLVPTRAASLPELLPAYEPFAGVGACWLLFGSSGRPKWTDGWVVRRFTRRLGAVDRHVKCIVQPARVERSVVVGHQFQPRPPWTMVDEKGRELTSPFANDPSAHTIRIHHYLTKSIEEMRLRRTSRHVTAGEQQLVPLASWLEWEPGWNDTEDTTLLRFLPAMRAQAARLGLLEPTDPTLD